MSAAIHTPDAVPITVKRIVYSLYSLLFLCVNMFLWILPATFLYFHLGQTTEKKRLRLHRFICWASDFVIHRVPGTTFTRVNPTSETFEKPALILSNHQSHLDLMCLLSLTPKLVVLTNDWVHRNPIYGLLIRYAEFYTVSDGLETNLERLADLVRRGYSIVVFPEGTRSPDCRIQRFHRGAFYLAEKLQLDLLPVFLHGIGHVLPKNDFMLREGALYTEIGARIPCHDPRYGVDFKTRTSNLRKYYITHYAEICAEREGADYYAWYVYQKYRAQGRKIGRACRRTLQKQGNFRTVIDQAPLVPCIRIDHSSTGEFALLYALVHPQTEVYALEPDPKRLAIASRALTLPTNLHLSADDHGIPLPDIHYRLKEDGTPIRLPQPNRSNLSIV